MTNTTTRFGRQTRTAGGILISGAGIAGPALAYWLHRNGFAATVVERSAFLRDSGGAVDFRGEQVKLLKAMGIFDAVKAAETAMGDEVIIDGAGQPVLAFSSAFFSGEVEIERGDLARILYDATRAYADYVFGDWIVGLEQQPDRVRVTFASGAEADYDLVVGADGLHSGVRGLAFGPEERFRKDLGWATAGFTAPNDLGLDHEGGIYNVPARGVMASIGRDRDRLGVGLVFQAPGLQYDRRDTAAQKDLPAASSPGSPPGPRTRWSTRSTRRLWFRCRSRRRGRGRPWRRESTSAGDCSDRSARNPPPGRPVRSSGRTRGRTRPVIVDSPHPTPDRDQARTESAGDEVLCPISHLKMLSGYPHAPISQNPLAWAILFWLLDRPRPHLGARGFPAVLGQGSVAGGAHSRGIRILQARR